MGYNNNMFKAYVVLSLIPDQVENIYGSKKKWRKLYTCGTHVPGGVGNVVISVYSQYHWVFLIVSIIWFCSVTEVRNRK